MRQHVVAQTSSPTSTIPCLYLVRTNNTLFPSLTVSVFPLLAYRLATKQDKHDNGYHAGVGGRGYMPQ